MHQNGKKFENKTLVVNIRVEGGGGWTAVQCHAWLATVWCKNYNFLFPTLFLFVDELSNDHLPTVCPLTRTAYDCLPLCQDFIINGRASPIADSTYPLYSFAYISYLFGSHQDCKVSIQMLQKALITFLNPNFNFT